jgi:hypothetical protein
VFHFSATHRRGATFRLESLTNVRHFHPRSKEASFDELTQIFIDNLTLHSKHPIPRERPSFKSSQARVLIFLTTGVTYHILSNFGNGVLYAGNYTRIYIYGDHYPVVVCAARSPALITSACINEKIYCTFRL